MDSSQSRASLVDLIFAKCQMVYGRDFSSRWEGMNLADVKADWGRELGGWLQKPKAIRYALEHLPEKPPHILTFRAILNCAPEESPVALPRPNPTPADKARVRQMLAGLKQKFTREA